MAKTKTPKKPLPLPVFISATGLDKDGIHYLEFKPVGSSSEKPGIVLPLSEINVHPNELFKELGERGMPFASSSAKTQLLNMIQKVEIESPLPVVTSMGWNELDFVTPRCVYAADGFSKLV